MIWNNRQKLHLGCGGNIIPNWINIDLDSPNADRHCDLTHPLPFKDASVDYVFTEHFIEHITRLQAVILLKECRRVMKSGAVIRISTPDLKWLVNQYSLGQIDEWADLGWLPSTPCQLINEGMRSWSHQFLYDLDELTSILKESGFQDVRAVNRHESDHATLRNLECRPWHNEIIIEAR